MSYCRFSPDSDLYVVHTRDHFECLACELVLEEYSSWRCDTHTELYWHLLDHRDAGHKVPVKAITRVLSELHNRDTLNEIEALMYRLAAPDTAFREFVARVKICMIVEDLFSALSELDELNWPPDELDD